MQTKSVSIYIWIVQLYIGDVFAIYWFTDSITLWMGAFGYIFFWELKEIKNRRNTPKWIT